MAAEAIELDVEGIPVRLSSPDKLYFPELGLTKRDIASYVTRVGAGLLAALRDRPTTMERWPGGVVAEAEPFFQKRIPQGAPAWVKRASVRFPSGRTAETPAPDNLATLVWMVNLGTLRFHPWPVRASDTDAVDELRLDLDPQPGTGFADAVAAAFELRAVLADAGLSAWCKTSGGRGVHVYAPIIPTDFVSARHAAIAIGRELARRMPTRVTLNWWKEERGERVFLDYNQMARDRLMSSAYSIRPVAEARVSMPLHWDALATAVPAVFTAASAPAIVASEGDAWALMASDQPGDIAKALSWYERDAAAGEGELPYPPEHPKMPGEPPRVQPSRARSTE